MALALLLAAGCSRTERWQEDVRLSTGQVIRVDRSGSDTDEWIRFSLPGDPTQQLEWHSRRDGNWQLEEPVVLDVENGAPVVLTMVVTSPGCRLFTKYTSINGVWQEEVLPDKFKGHELNLFVRGGLDVADIVTLDQKRRDGAAISYDRALSYLGPQNKVCAR